MKVFGNAIDPRVVNRAQKKARGCVKRFGDDSQGEYVLKLMEHPQLGQTLGLWDIALNGDPLVNGTPPESAVFDSRKSIIVGNIRMGFGHYRIAIAMASAANALGIRPYWFDLHRYQETTGGKIVAHLNGLYAMGSRWSQQYKLFNKLYWEPLNSEGFRKLSYHVEDWHTTQLMTPIFKNLPKEMPFIGTHVWPAQAAVHAGMTKVVNAIPDNWPMALHLAEGTLHTVQTPSSYWGYRNLKGMQGDTVLRPMPKEAISMTGHYIDAEILESLEGDNILRRQRLSSDAPLRVLITVGGAGAQFALFKALIEKLMPYVQKKRVLLMLNVGDHLGVWEKLERAIPGLKELTEEHFDQWEGTKGWISKLNEHPAGIHAFYHKDIFAAVYSTNLMMPKVDLMLTKPSELAFYPVPKLMLPRVGGHEAWGAVRAAELGDGTPECETIEAALIQLETLLEDKDALLAMIDAIDLQSKIGTYDGAFKVVQHAMDMPTSGRL